MNPCRDWSATICSGAKYWQWARLRLDLEMDSNQLTSLLKSGVMKRVPEFDIFYGTGWLEPGSNLQLILAIGQLMDSEKLQV